jgi:hypothetical protein
MIVLVRESGIKKIDRFTWLLKSSVLHHHRAASARTWKPQNASAQGGAGEGGTTAGGEPDPTILNVCSRSSRRKGRHSGRSWSHFGKSFEEKEISSFVAGPFTICGSG